jgi:hypothetical protein
MKNRRNYYRVLHIQPDAPLDIIKASYRTQMQKLKMHPDLGGDEWDASVLNEAYRVLSNPIKRAAYDAAFIGNRNGLKTASQTCSNNNYARRQTDNTAAAGEPFDKSACAFCQTPRPGDASFLDHPFCSGCGGPLQVAATLRLADPAKRAFERMPHHAPLTVHLDTNCQGQRGKLRDLSPVGLQMQTPAPLKAGQVVRISGEVVAAIGRVVFCNRNPDSRYFTAGVEFLTVCFHSRAGTFIKGNA